MGQDRLLLQIALDTLPLGAAVELAVRVAEWVDVVEAGTPLIKREGLRAVRDLKRALPGTTVFADMKVMDGGALEAGLAFEAGADGISVLAAAPDATVRAVVTAARAARRFVIADLLGVVDAVARARELAALGVDGLGVHRGVDEHHAGVGADPLASVAELTAAVDLPLMVAGGIDAERAAELVAYRPHWVVVGGAICGAANPMAAARAVREALDRGQPVAGTPKPSPGIAARNAIQTVVAEQAATARRVDPREVAALTAAVEAAGRVFVCGAGRSGLVGQLFAKRLVHLGLAAEVVGGTTTPPIAVGDLLLAISGSGGTGTTRLFAETAREVGAHVAAITAEPGSALGTTADLVIRVPAPAKGGHGEGGSVQYEGSVFEQAAFTLLEAVVYALMTARGGTNASLQTRHANLE